jgi:hypothetical protein
MQTTVLPLVYETTFYKLFKRRILGSESSGYEESYLLGYCGVQSVESQPKFWRNMSHLQGRRISQARNQHETGAPKITNNKNLFRCFVPRETFLILASCLAYFSILKMKGTCSSRTLVDFQRTTWHTIPEDRTLTQIDFELKSVNMRVFKTCADKRPRKHIRV